MRQRSDRIFSALDSDIDTVVLANGESHLSDSTFKYVSGVTSGGFEGCAAILRRGERPTLAVSALEEESARTAHDCDIAVYANVAARGEILGTLLGPAKRIGVNARAITWSNVRRLEEAAPEAEIVDVADAITKARLVKDQLEVERIRRACQVTSDIAGELPAMPRGGMTEIELSAELAHAIQKRGGKVAFDTIVCFGETGSKPHYSPAEVPLERGHMILVDFGTLLGDYCSDITRMYLYGEANDTQRGMFDVVRRAQAEALALTTAGRIAKEIHEKAVEIIDATEYKGRFIHGLGHSIGLEVHDGGGINSSSELVLEPGMVMTVEPGVYVTGLGGVRIEDTVPLADHARRGGRPVAAYAFVTISFEG